MTIIYLSLKKGKDVHLSVFSQRIVAWQKQYGRHDLPWHGPDPYAIWVSEIMLQQTQVSVVRDYFIRFMRAFPTVQTLAAAEETEVLQKWAGLGYYSRARYLHQSAQILVTVYGNEFPQTRQAWQMLKGVGRSTAAAIVAFAFQKREAILDGNVKRILARVFLISDSIFNLSTEKKLWSLAESLLPENSEFMSAYTQGLMDLGASICLKTKPLCCSCPVANMCGAYQKNKTDTIPNRDKKIKVQNINYFWLLLFNHQQELLVEKRSNQGIWAGLFTPLTFADDHLMFRWLNDQGLSTEVHSMPIIKHRLTHRKLNIYPYQVIYPAEIINKSQFYAPSLLKKMAIPKPFSHLLQQYL